MSFQQAFNPFRCVWCDSTYLFFIYFHDSMNKIYSWLFKNILLDSSSQHQSVTNHHNQYRVVSLIYWPIIGPCVQILAIQRLIWGLLLDIVQRRMRFVKTGWENKNRARYKRKLCKASKEWSHWNIIAIVNVSVLWKTVLGGVNNREDAGGCQGWCYLCLMCQSRWQEMHCMSLRHLLQPQMPEEGLEPTQAPLCARHGPEDWAQGQWADCLKRF